VVNRESDDVVVHEIQEKVRAVELQNQLSDTGLWFMNNDESYRAENGEEFQSLRC
jgi:hypothetical protein